MGKPAARISDMHTCPMVNPGTPPIPHVGGPVSGPGVPTVLIGNMPAAVVGDMCICVGPPDTIAMGSSGVLIGGKPAARMGDSTAHGGVIAIGLPTVLIGDTGQAQLTSSACSDEKVPDLTHIEKMESAIKQSDIAGAVLDELGGIGGIAAGIIGAGLVLGAIALAPAGLLAGAVAVAVGEVAILAGAAMSGYQIGEGIAHIADFYNQTEVASTCQDLKDAGKTFEQGVAKIGVGGVNAVLGAASKTGKLSSEGTSALRAKRLQLVKKLRKKRATEFYKKHNPNPKLTARQLRSKTNGIDFTKPVKRVNITKNGLGSDEKPLHQYTKVNTKGEVIRGEYYTDNPNTTTSELGISNKYSVRNENFEQTDDVKEVIIKQMTFDKPMEGLQSTSAKINDTWSLKGQKIPTTGGGNQIYVPKNQ